MSWPLKLRCGWQAVEMADLRQRSWHVRRHLLRTAEAWQEICGAPSPVLEQARAEVKGAGLRVGPAASLHEAPGSAGHDTAERLFVRWYSPAASFALASASDEGSGCSEDEKRKARVAWVVTDDGLVVICKGSDSLMMKTAYRLFRSHRRSCSLEVLVARKRRALQDQHGFDAGGR